MLDFVDAQIEDVGSENNLRIPGAASGSGVPGLPLGGAGTPAIIGIRKGRMEWMISGLLKDPATLTSAIRTRVEYRAHQPELNRHGARFLPTDRAIPSARPASPA